MKLQDIYFGVQYWDSNAKKMTTINIFEHPKVRRAVAEYRLHPDRYKGHNIIDLIFSDFRGRCEYEWMVMDWPRQEISMKVDVFDSYIEPNRNLLLELINLPSKNSCVEWLKEYRKQKRGSTK